MKLKKKLLSIAAIAAVFSMPQSVLAEDIVISPEPGSDIGTELATAQSSQSTYDGIIINLTKGANYTITKSLVTKNSLVINGNDATIDASSINGTFISMSGSTVNAKKSDDTESSFKWYGDIVIDDVVINGLGKSLVTCTETARADLIEVKNSMIEFSGSNNIFALGNAFYLNLKVSNSTLWSKEGHTGYFIKSDARPNNLENPHPKYITTTVEKSTFYQISKDKQFNNSNGQMKGQSFLKQVLTQSILVYSGNNNATKGWMFGQASNAVTLVFDRNTYWTDADYSSNWTSYDKSGTILTTFTGFADAANGDFTVNKSSDQYTYKTGDPRWLGEKISITAAGYATYCSTKALDFTGTGLTAYIAKKSGTEVSFEAKTKIPANTGFLLKGDAGTYYIPDASETDDVTGNAFVGLTAQTDVDAGSFVLMNGDEGVGFYKATQPFTLGAHTAYLSALSSSRSFIGFNENMTTGVDDVSSKTEDVRGVVYDLSGRRVAQPTKGLYIVNGKVVVMK